MLIQFEAYNALPKQYLLLVERTNTCQLKNHNFKITSNLTASDNQLSDHLLIATVAAFLNLVTSKNT